MEWKTLPEARYTLRLSQLQLAEDLEVSREIVSLWERRKASPSPAYEHRLREYFREKGIALDLQCANQEANASLPAENNKDVSTREETKKRAPAEEAPTPPEEGLDDAPPEEELYESMRADPEVSPEDATSSDQSLLDPITPAPAPSSSSLMRPYAPTLQHFIVSDPARHFWHIAHTDYDTSDKMRTVIQSAIKDMNMTTGDPITRRDALCELASIPMIAMGRNAILKASRYEEMLRYCTAALEGCWELYRGSDPVGARHAFQCCATYVPLLETIAHDSSKHRAQALDLAARYALLKTLLGWNCADPWEAVDYAQHALSLSRESGSILLQLSAHPKVSWAYVRTRQYTRAWEIMQKGKLMLESHQSKNDGPPLPSGIIGNFCSSYCQAQVKNGILPDRELGIAAESSPLDEAIAMVDFTIDGKFWEVAWIYAAKGDPEQAMKWLEKLIDTETLADRQELPLSESDRIGAINILTDVLLQSKERDMSRIIRTWKAGMKGARALKHEVMYQEAHAHFEVMQSLWRGEDAIRRLMPLTSHW